MLYRVVRMLSGGLPLVVLWGFIGAFLAALPLMFIWPQGSLLLLFVCLPALGLTILAVRAISSAQHGLARHDRAQGMCPVCRRSDNAARVQGAWQCAFCHTMFLASGEEVDHPHSSNLPFFDSLRDAADQS